MKPILFSSGETQFSTNGLGILTDAISCVVTEERNGAFELEMTYPVSGIHFEEIKTRCLIMAKPNPVDDPQPFRVYRITKPMGGMVTVYGEHISYDLAGIPVSPFSAGSAAEAMTKLKSSSAVANPFTFWTDKSTVATMKVTAPTALRALLGGHEGSVLDVYGGEYKFDRYAVRLYEQRGENRGVSIRYGKNLTDLTQDENIAGVYTGVYPYWSDMDGNLVELPEKILPAPGTYDFTRIMTLDLSSEFETDPTVDSLRSRAQTYMKSNNIGVPKVSIEVSFVPLEQTEEYKDLALLERVELCDTVNVEFPALGVSATAKCVRTIFDVLLDRYRSVELGDARTNIADTIVAQQQKIEKAPTVTAMKQAVDSATSQITGNKGGYVQLKYGADGKTPEEILIMDTPNIETATKVWRWNKNGLGYSSNGYNGPYGLAMTQDGAIVADFITAGILTANIIKAGILQSLNQVTSMNLESGALVFRIENGFMMLNSSGLSVHNSDGTVKGLFAATENKTSWLKTDAGMISTFYAETIDILEGDKTILQIAVDKELTPNMFSNTSIKIPNGITTQNAFRVVDKNNKETGIFGADQQGNSTLIVSKATIGTAVFPSAKVDDLYSYSGGTINSHNSVRITGNLEVTGTISGNIPGGGVDDDLSVNSLDAGYISTDVLRVEGLTFAPETITDKNGERWTVLAIAGR